MLTHRMSGAPCGAGTSRTMICQSVAVPCTPRDGFAASSLEASARLPIARARRIRRAQPRPVDGPAGVGLRHLPRPPRLRGVPPPLQQLHPRRRSIRAAPRPRAPRRAPHLRHAEAALPHPRRVRQRELVFVALSLPSRACTRSSNPTRVTTRPPSAPHSSTAGRRLRRGCCPFRGNASTSTSASSSTPSTRAPEDVLMRGVLLHAVSQAVRSSRVVLALVLRRVVRVREPGGASGFTKRFFAAWAVVATSTPSCRASRARALAGTRTTRARRSRRVERKRRHCLV